VIRLASLFVLCSSFIFVQAQASEEKDWELQASYLGTGGAEIDEAGKENESIGFTQSIAKASYTHRLDDESGIVLNVGHTSTQIDWDENPSFSEKNYSYLNLEIGGYSLKIPNWLWRGAVGTDVDAEELSFNRYALYKGTMWGRYDFSDMLGIHIGFTGTSGLRRDKVYPILGLDYAPSSKWKLNFIFPVDISANYAIDDNWSVAGTARTFRVRHRLSQKEATSRGIFDYRSFGGDLSLNYLIGSFLAKAYVGTTYSGDLKVADSKARNAVFYKFNGSIYLGSNLTYQF
jgi:hypothetical protein